MTNTKYCFISEEIYKPILLKDQILQPYLLEVEIKRIGASIIECYLISAEIQYKHYLQLYQNIINTSDIFIFQLKQTTAKKDQFRNWIKIIPISINPKILFIVESSNTELQQNFQNRLQKYFRKTIQSSVLFISPSIDKSQILQIIGQIQNNLITIQDYHPESNTISQVKSFFKFSKWRKTQEQSIV